jgi:hypothetical protein
MEQYCHHFDREVVVSDTLPRSPGRRRGAMHTVRSEDLSIPLDGRRIVAASRCLAGDLDHQVDGAGQTRETLFKIVCRPCGLPIAACSRDRVSQAVLSCGVYRDGLVECGLGCLPVPVRQFGACRRHLAPGVSAMMQIAGSPSVLLLALGRSVP